MSIVTRYANQLVTLERRSRDEDGTPLGNQWEGAIYEDAETIKARYVPSFGTTRTATGDATQAETYVLTEEPVRLLDKIEGSEVKRVETIVTKRGTVLGYEVYL